MKVVIVGAVAAGATFATNLRRLDESAQIVMFDKGRDMAFGNCEIPYYLSYDIKNSKSLIFRDENSFKSGSNINAKALHEVIGIDRENKSVRVRNIKENKEFDESYDYLVLAPGTIENVPSSIKGTDKDNVFFVKDVRDVENIRKYITENEVKDIFVAGAGFVAIEAAENLNSLGKNVSILIRKPTSLLKQVDDEIKAFIMANLKDHINVISDKNLVEIGDKEVIFDDGSRIRSDLNILALGSRPNNILAKLSKLELTANDSIKVDDNFRTSDENIFAIGDVIEVENFITGKKEKLNLAWPAHRQAKFLANYLVGKKNKTPKFIGSFALRSFDLNVAATGLSEKMCIDLGLDYESTLISSTDRVGIMPDAKKICIKQIFDKNTGKILGAFGVGPGVVDKRIDVIGAMIKMKADIYDLYDLELIYQPLYSKVEDPINTLAKQAIEVKEGKVKFVRLKDLSNTVDDYDIYDLRDKQIYDKSHLHSAKLLPFSDLRKSISQISKDKKVLLYDSNGSKAKKAMKLLKNLGYENIHILEGSFEFLKVYNDLFDLSLLEASR